jgi:pyrroline-5-carboxylate reductase
VDNLLIGKRIGFIGGGNVAEALIKGLLANELSDTLITVQEPLQLRRAYLEECYKVKVVDRIKGAEVLVLAIKPQIAGKVLPELREIVTPNTVVISVMAGITSAKIEEILGNESKVIRVMPNTPALVMAGASAISPGRNATSNDMQIATAMFSSVGITTVVDERLLDAVTGVSGSGPAYVMTFIEALADGGVKNGLARDTAFKLAGQTVLGTAKLCLESDEHPAVLRDKVASPGGTTIAAIHALEEGKLRATIIDAVDAAVRRSKELGK